VSGADLALLASVFLACAVEAVEALTIVLAVGHTRNWSSSLYGCGSAVLALAVLVVALGPALTRLPVDALRLLVGATLLAFGLRWLRKAVLRAARLKPLRDEIAAFEAESAAAQVADAQTVGAHIAGIDVYAFVASFKGVLLEGLEVVIIVLTLGASRHRLTLAAAAAAGAIVVVALAGLVVRAPLARVPENTIKFAVGVMLTSFGAFWAMEGAGLSWPGGDAALLAIVPVVALASLAIAARLRSTLVVEPAGE
jgi:uncharacterized membrane protein